MGLLKALVRHLNPLFYNKKIAKFDKNFSKTIAKCNKMCYNNITKNLLKKAEELNIMNKQQLVDVVAQNTGMTKKDSVAAVSAILDVITTALASGEDVKITGFGSFEVKTREARTGRNPKTGAPVEIPASKYVSFSAGSVLKEKVN